MGGFNIADAAGHAYFRTWQERKYLIRLALAPMLIKFVCFVAMFSLGIEDNHIRLTLVFLPALFAEGWMLSHWVRLIFLEQRWPFRPSGNDEADLHALDDRARGVLSGTIMYVLLQMLVTGFFALLVDVLLSEDALDNPGAGVKVFSIGLFIFMLWGFRYLWVFIPLSFNYSLKEFLRVIQDPKLSFFMVGVWLLCCVPGYLIMMNLTLPALYSDPPDSQVFAQFTAAGVHVVVETAVNILATGGMAYGLKELVERKGRS